MPTPRRIRSVLDMNSTGPQCPTIVVGAGPAGLASARLLQRQGIPTLVLEQRHTAGASWRSHPANLRLHTARRLSSLPGPRLPRRFGEYVANRSVYRYLRDYAEDALLTIEFGIQVSEIRPEPTSRDGARWIILTSTPRCTLRWPNGAIPGMRHNPGPPGNRMRDHERKAVAITLPPDLRQRPLL